MKKGTSFRLSDEALRLIALLTAHLGLSQASVVELAVRDLARKNKLA
jgi:predicted DNA-binding protein